MAQIDSNDALNHILKEWQNTIVTVDTECQDEAHGFLIEWMLNNDDVDEYIIHSCIQKGSFGTADQIVLTALGLTVDDDLFQFRIYLNDTNNNSCSDMMLAPAILNIQIPRTKPMSNSSDPSKAYDRAMKGII